MIKAIRRAMPRTGIVALARSPQRHAANEALEADVEASADAGDIRQSDQIGEAMLSLRTFMFDRVYLGDQARSDNARAEAVVRKIFDHLIARGDPTQQAVDYVAGMTDRFAFAYAAEL